MPMLDEFRPNFNPDELRINEDFEIGVDFGAEFPTPTLKKQRFTMRKAMEITIEVWSWLEDTGNSSIDAWLERRGIDYYLYGHLPICDYANKVRRRNRQNISLSTCPYCPFFIFFNYKCNRPHDFYDKWLREGNPEKKKKLARLFLGELLKVQKELILHPENFRPKEEK